MKIERKSYYDIDAEYTAALLNDMLYLQDLQDRKLFLPSDITQDSVFDIVKHIMQYNAEDKGKEIEDRKPVILYIASCGGELDAGFELIDAIEASTTPIYTVNLGYEYSMAFLIGLAGHTRFAMPNAKFLMHDGSGMFLDFGAKLQDQIEFQKNVMQRIRHYDLLHTRISEEEYDKNLRVEWYMFAEEAKDRGVIDKIIGEDCDLDEIV